MPKFSCSPGFFLLLAILIFLDDGSRIFIWSVLWAAIHEIGHVATAKLFRGRVEEARLNSAGIELRMAYPHILPYAAENFVLIGGPVFNLLAALIAMWIGSHLGAVIGFGLGIFNLLPVLPLDGGRLWLNLISSRFGPSVGERVLLAAAVVISGLLLGIGLIALVKFANGIFILLAGWLLLNALKKAGKNKYFS